MATAPDSFRKFENDWRDPELVALMAMVYELEQQRKVMEDMRRSIHEAATNTR
jgi:hypothetical protein